MARLELAHVYAHLIHVMWEADFKYINSIYVKIYI